jgi:hypothetical protein
MGIAAAIRYRDLLRSADALGDLPACLTRLNSRQ